MTPSGHSGELKFSILFFLRFIVIGATFPMMSLWVEDKWGSTANVGFFMGTIALVSIASQQFWGYMADMFWTRVSIMRVTILVGMCLLAWTAHLETFSAFLIVWVFIGFCMTPVNPMMNSMVMNAPELAENYPRIRCWGSLGFIFANLFVGSLCDIYQSKMIAFHFAVAGGLLTWAWLWGIRAPQIKPTTRINFLQVQRVFVTRRHFIWFLVALFINRMAHAPMMLFQTFQVEKLVPPEHANSAALTIFVVGAVVEVPFFFFGRWVLQRFGLLQMLMFSSGLAVIRFLIVPHVGYWGLLASQILHGFTFGLYYLAGVAWINKHTPKEVRTSGQTIFNMVWFGLAPAIGQPVFGALYEAFGVTHPALIFSGGSMVILLSMVILGRAIKNEPAGPPEPLPLPGESSLNQ